MFAYHFKPSAVSFIAAGFQPFCRFIRRDGNVFLKKEEKNSDISKDVIKDMEDKIQKLTDQKIKDLEAVTDKKVKEILSV